MKLISSNHKQLLLASSLLFLSACGGSSSEDDMATVSFSVSDAPVDSAQQVVIAFDQIELVKSGEDNIVLDVVGDNGEDYRQIDLLQYQGSDSTLIVSNQQIPTGTYDNLILHILDESSGSDLSYVVGDNGQIPLKQPSNKLQLGGFTVGSDSVQAFTIEFDLRQALVENQNGNRYNLKPHGVKILDNAEVAAVSGNVDINLFSGGTDCNYDTGNFVYLYSGHNLDSALLGDSYDPDVNVATLPEGEIAPYSSAPVTYTSGNYGQYDLGYLPTGNYTIAFTCSADNDAPEQYDGITIANPSEQLHEITVTAGSDVTQDFNAQQ